MNTWLGPRSIKAPSSYIRLDALLYKTEEEERGVRGDPVWAGVALLQRVGGSAVGHCGGQKGRRGAHLAEMLFYANPGWGPHLNCLHSLNLMLALPHAFFTSQIFWRGTFFSAIRHPRNDKCQLLSGWCFKVFKLFKVTVKVLGLTDNRGFSRR